MSNFFITLFFSHQFLSISKNKFKKLSIKLEPDQNNNKTNDKSKIITDKIKNESNFVTNQFNSLKLIDLINDISSPNRIAITPDKNPLIEHKAIQTIADEQNDIYSSISPQMQTIFNNVANWVEPDNELSSDIKLKGGKVMGNDEYQSFLKKTDENLKKSDPDRYNAVQMQLKTNPVGFDSESNKDQSYQSKFDKISQFYENIIEDRELKDRKVREGLKSISINNNIDFDANNKLVYKDKSDVLIDKKDIEAKYNGSSDKNILEKNSDTNSHTKSNDENEEGIPMIDPDVLAAQKEFWANEKEIEKNQEEIKNNLRIMDNHTRKVFDSKLKSRNIKL